MPAHVPVVVGSAREVLRHSAVTGQLAHNAFASFVGAGSPTSAGKNVAVPTPLPAARACHSGRFNSSARSSSTDAVAYGVISQVTIVSASSTVSTVGRVDHHFDMGHHGRDEDDVERPRAIGRVSEGLVS